MGKGWLLATLALAVTVLGVGLAINYLWNGSAVAENSPVDGAENKILIHVYVKLDPPPENAINDITYKPREGIPTEVGVYRAYLWEGRWGAWKYEKLDTILLERVDNLTLYGAKSVSKTNPVLVEDNNLQMYDNALCVGYPGIKYVLYCIDGITFVRIDQSVEETTVTVYYWEGSAPIPPADTSSGHLSWQVMCFSPLF